ncbi:MAG: hypothetical protein JW709_12510 [Sedimentisphaerales bacterium]|nr:hypothetical protein [Sedimentisphaerales bacterium]
MKTSPNSVVIIAILFLASMSAPGQQYISQQGRALDANPQIGSYGYNTAVPLDTLIPSGNLYITGNVSGGMRFQGLVPYRSSYEFSADTGSGLLSDFRRDSFGLNQPIYGPHSYLDPSRAVTATYGGQVVNTAQAMNTPITPVGAAWRTGAVAAYQRDEMLVRPYSRGFSPLSTGPASPAALAGSLPMPYTATRPHTLLPSESTTNLTTPAYRPLVTPQQTEQEPTETTPSQIISGEEIPANTPTVPAWQEQVNEESNLFQQNLLQTLMQPPAQPKQPPTPEEQGEEPLGLSGPGLSLTPIRTITPSTTTVVSPPNLSALVASQREQFYKYLRQGRDYLYKGEYYRAADQFSLAALYQPRNPGVYLARCHALLGAGEFLSAAFYLSKALTAPPTTSDAVPATLPTVPVLQERLTEIKRWREQTAEPMLLFIQGYVEACLGQSDQARQTLTQAAEEMPAEPAIQRLLSTLTASPAETTP